MFPSHDLYDIDETDPIESTITVTVNGQVTNDWSYDHTNNTVVFKEDSVPEPGQTIIIEYAV